MSTPARARTSQPRSVTARTGEGDAVLDLTEGTPPVDAAGAQRGAVANQVKMISEGADDPIMTETTPARREVGISFPMTTTAQVEHRDAIRERTQARLDALRSRTPRTPPHSRRTART